MNQFESLAVFGIASTVLLSFLYFLILESLKIHQKADTSGLISLFTRRKVVGFALFGVIPAVMVRIIFLQDPLRFGLTWGNTGRMWPWIAIAAAFFILLNLFNSKNRDIRAVYPEMRLEDWNLARIGIGAGGWLIYLAGYEYLFRGLLLLGCHEAFGLWPAVSINLALYSALHLPKGLKEAVAALPFGALICYLTIESQSIVPAVIIHSLQAISCELFCIMRNHEMKFILKNS